MQLSISLAGCFKLPGRNRKPAPGGKPAPDKDSYFEYMAESLLNNNRTIIDWPGERAANKEYRADCGSSFYDKLVYRFLSNFSTFKSND